MNELISNITKKVTKKTNLSSCFQSEIVKNFDEVRDTENLQYNHISPDNKKIIDENENENKKNDIVNLNFKFLSPDETQLMNMSTMNTNDKFISPLITSMKINTSKFDSQFSLISSDKVFLKEVPLIINDKSKNLGRSLTESQNNKHLNVPSINSKFTPRNKNRSLSFSKTFLKNKLMINNNYNNKSSSSVSSFNSENNNSEYITKDTGNLYINKRDNKIIFNDINSKSPSTSTFMDKNIGHNKKYATDDLLLIPSRSTPNFNDVDKQQFFCKTDKYISANNKYNNALCLDFINSCFKNKLILEVDEDEDEDEEYCEDKEMSPNFPDTKKWTFRSQTSQKGSQRIEDNSPSPNTKNMRAKSIFFDKNIESTIINNECPSDLDHVSKLFDLDKDRNSSGNQIKFKETSSKSEIKIIKISIDSSASKSRKIELNVNPNYKYNLQNPLNCSSVESSNGSNKNEFNININITNDNIKKKNKIDCCCLIF
jgi:hypothetical protein